jgi:Domain of unknown function (DUF1840)
LANLQAADGQATAAPPALNEDRSAEDDEKREPPVALTARATPLIEMLQRAAAANREVMWEQTS